MFYKFYPAKVKNIFISPKDIFIASTDEKKQ